MDLHSEDRELFPDVDTAGALRAAFRARDPSSRDPRRATAIRPGEPHTERQGYEVENEIARGGMGVIVKAVDRGLSREVALKVLRDELAHEPRMVRRFLAEARITARLDHPGIVPVHQVGEDARGRAYFAMRLVRGRDLRKIMELANSNREGWSTTRALSVFLKVCEAMAYAHDKGVIHRDLKPSNVMVGAFGEVYVMDWGLARADGDADAHDLRLRDSASSTAAMDARDAASAVASRGRDPSASRARDADEARKLANLESPLVTADGEVLGTPCYMSPEQARGRIGEVGPRSDVYSVGAMLYHLLASEPPYLPAGTSTSGRSVLEHLAQGPPRSLQALARDIPAELIAICDRAMARDAAQRYPSMVEMSEDVRAFLERRVVRAYETGAWAEAKKWVRRNRALSTASAAAALALVGGLIGSLILKAQSDRNAKLARENADVAERSHVHAESERERAETNAERALASERTATERAEDVFRLSALQDLDDLIAEADGLWPVRAEMIPRYEAWLSRAERVVGELPAHEDKLAELRARALPTTAALASTARARYPRIAELEKLERALTYHRMLQAALGSTKTAHDADPRTVGVDLASLPATAQAVDDLARPLVDPTRADWGGEARGLVLARHAIELAGPLIPSERAPIRDTLAWALLANGRVDEAIVEEQRALEEAGAARSPEIERRVDELRATIDEWLSPQGREREAHSITDLEARVAALDAEASKLRERVFADTHDRWWHNQLEKLVDGLKAFDDPATGLFSSGTAPQHGWGMKKRLAFAETVEERSVGGTDARARWSEAIASIRDESASSKYHGLAIRPQLGLLPIGRDPDSGLWEFAHLETGVPPHRGADGKLVLTEEMGLVFVLLPGGRFHVGAQRDDPNGPNFDPQALDSEGPVHEFEMSPFFVSKYEMTQAQWKRFTGNNPSIHASTYYLAEWSRLHRAWSDLHPVENVTWFACAETLARADLELPTEPQWEYACRAGTTTPFWTGADPQSLRGAENLSDAYSKTHGNDSWQSWEAWLDDGETLHAEVGSYRANPFGLHDMHGNVSEWCKERYLGPAVRPGDRNSVGGQHRVLRGGDFGGVAGLARATSRNIAGDGHATIDIFGVRPVRSLTR